MSNLGTSDMVILVTVKDVYGEKKVYPFCAKANAFASIANTKTLRVMDLKRIRALGYDVRLAHGFMGEVVEGFQIPVNIQGGGMAA